jgi:hypothetical protein
MSRYLPVFAIFALPLSAAIVGAQEDYPPGSFQIAPEVDLHLQPVEVVIPTKFRNQVPQNAVLNVPPACAM